MKIKWLTKEQFDLIDKIVVTDFHSPFILQMLINTRMTSNQLMECNKIFKQYGRKLLRKKYDYKLIKV